MQNLTARLMQGAYCLELVFGLMSSVDAADFHFGCLIIDTAKEHEYPELSAEIEGSKHFAQEIVRGYRKLVESRIDLAFRDSFLFYSGNAISASLILSTVRESFLGIDTGRADTFFAEISEWPVQPRLFDPRFRPEKRSTSIAPFSEWATKYDAIQPGFEMAGDGAEFYAHGGVFGFYSMKPMKLVPNYLTILCGTLSMELIGSDSVVNRFRTPLLSIFTGSPGFSWAGSKLESISSRAFRFHQSDVFGRSELFRQSVANPILKPEAEAIAARLAASRIKNDYPYFEQQIDEQKLILHAKRLGITEPNYVPVLLGQAKDATPSGSLWWVYTSHEGFAYQWSIMNLSLMVFICVFRIIRPLWRRFANLMKDGNNKLPRILTPIGSVLALNGYVLIVRLPQGFGILSDGWVPLGLGIAQ